MITSLLLYLPLFLASSAIAATPGFRLGVTSTTPLGDISLEQSVQVVLATDGAGALYLLGTGLPSAIPATTILGPSDLPSSYVMKMPPGRATAYLVTLGFHAIAMATDPSGNVYVASASSVAKLNQAGTAFVYQKQFADGLVIDNLAVDGSGRAYIAGHAKGGTLTTTPNAFQPTASSGTSHAFVARVNAAGDAFDYATYLAGSGADLPSGLAVDAAGMVAVSGSTTSPDFPVTEGSYPVNSSGTLSVPFLARLAADGSRLVYATLTGGPGDEAQAVATDPGGNAVVYQRESTGTLSLLRFTPQGAGALLFHTTALQASRNVGRGLAMDSAGNTYITGYSQAANYPLKGSLAPCGSLYLTVVDPAGQLLQSTYLTGVASPGSFPYLGNAIAVAPDSTVYVIAYYYIASIPLLLTRLSPNTAAPTVQLGCIGNAASYDERAVSAGEIVSLFGEGLGPLQGTVPQVDSVTRRFPTQASGVQVTFNGIPAPLLYVQDSQINAIVPWALPVSAPPPAPWPTTEICVIYQGAKTNCLNRLTDRASPGVFMVDGQHAAALNQDGTLNSAANPARVGSIVSIFATGLGPISPSQGDGAIVGLPLPANVLPVKMEYLGSGYFVSQGDPQYAGPAPFEVAGVSQINFQLFDTRPLVVAWTGEFLSPAAQSLFFNIYVAEQ